MMLFRVLPLLLLTFSGANAHLKATATITPSRSAVLKIRGGAGPLDPTLAAKTLAIAAGAQGTFGLLASEKSRTVYGLPSEPAWDNALSFDANGSLGTCAVLMGLQLFFSTSYEEALGWSVIPYSAQLLYKLLNDKYKSVGMTNDKGWFLLAIQGLTMYSCLSNADWAPKWITFYVAFSLLNAVVLEVSPETGCKAWGLEYQNTAMRDHNCRIMAANLFGHTALVGGPLLFGLSTLESIGWYAAAICLILSTMMFATKDFDNLGESVNKEAILAWIGLLAIVAGTILL